MARPASPPTPSLAHQVDELQSRGKYIFTDSDIHRRTKASAVARQAALRRLRAKGRIATPRRGFHVVVPVEYKTAGAPPASWFIDGLARYLRQPYYVGLLSAAALHGAAHQQPLAFQVVTDRPTRPIEVGRVRIVFHVSRDVESSPVVEMQTETGSMRVSTPEVTAFDLVRFARAAGHISNVATVLDELAEKLVARKLAAVAVRYTPADAQRLGFILEKLGKTELTSALERRLDSWRLRPVLLAPGQRVGKRTLDPRWRVVPNHKIEVDR